MVGDQAASMIVSKDSFFNNDIELRSGNDGRVIDYDIAAIEKYEPLSIFIIGIQNRRSYGVYSIFKKYVGHSPNFKGGAIICVLIKKVKF